MSLDKKLLERAAQQSSSREGLGEEDSPRNTEVSLSLPLDLSLSLTHKQLTHSLTHLLTRSHGESFISSFFTH